MCEQGVMTVSHSGHEMLVLSVYSWTIAIATPLGQLVSFFFSGSLQSASMNSLYPCRKFDKKSSKQFRLCKLKRGGIIKTLPITIGCLRTMCLAP